MAPDDPQILTTRANLAAVRAESGRLDEAIGTVRDLLPDLGRVLGPEHPTTLTTRGNLAAWRGEAGDPAGAAAALAELLPDLERLLGPEHPTTLTCATTLQPGVARPEIP